MMLSIGCIYNYTATIEAITVPYSSMYTVHFFTVFLVCFVHSVHLNLISSFFQTCSQENLVPFDFDRTFLL